MNLHLTPEQLARRWHMNRGTLANWRAKGRGPRFIKLGTRVLYPLCHVEDYERENTR